MPRFSLIKILRRYMGVMIGLSILYALLLCVVISYKTKPSSKEKFSIFMDLSYGSAQTVKMENRIKEIDSKLKKVEVFSFSPSSSSYNTYYETKGKEADLLLLAKSYLTNKKMDNFALLNDYYKDGYFVEDNLYGLLCKKSSSDYFTLLDDEEYYCFVRSSSSHISSISSISYDDLAFTIMGEFFDAI